MKRGNVQVDKGASTVSGGDRKRVKLEAPEPEFQKLNQSDPAHARRIQQRRRMVAKGRNTVGYDEYLRQVPRQKRRPRFMKHPSTPDHTLDIPNKRWQGMVKAWRRALHQYDPPDLMKAFDEAAKEQPNAPNPTPSTVQAKQLSEAVEKGLLVDCSAECVLVSPCGAHDELSPEEHDELDQWEKERGDDGDFLLDDDDSDNDLI